MTLLSSGLNDVVAQKIILDTCVSDWTGEMFIDIIHVSREIIYGQHENDMKQFCHYHWTKENHLRNAFYSKDDTNDPRNRNPVFLKHLEKRNSAFINRFSEEKSSVPTKKRWFTQFVFTALIFLCINNTNIDIELFKL